MLILYLIFAFILHAALPHEIDDVAQYLPKPVIGAYFDKNGSFREAFSLAIHTVNNCMYDHEICETMHPSEVDTNVNLYHQVEFAAVTIESDNDLPSLHKNFGILTGVNDDQNAAMWAWSTDDEYGLSVIMGPHHCITSMYIQGLCEIHDIPNIVFRRELKYEHNPVQTINLYPDTETLSAMYLEMIKKLKWTDFSILYENSDNFVVLDKILKMYPPYTYGVYAIKMGRGSNYSIPLLKAKSMQHKNFLIDCSHDIMVDVLMQLQEVGMMTEAYEYIVTTLDIHALDLNLYSHSGVKLNGFQIVDIHNPFVHKFISDHMDDFGITSVENLRIDDALMFDAVALFAEAFKDLNYMHQMFRGATLRKDYSKPTPWKDGLSLRNYMLYTELNGLTGPLMLDGDGTRRRFKLDVVNLHQTGLKKVGEWNFEDGFQNLKLDKKNKMPHYKVLITLNTPYASKINHTKRLEGNARYEGFVIDIIEALAKELHFTYTFYVQKDSKNGDCHVQETSVNGKICTQCDGMMEKIMNHEMDMAITDLTVTENRATCVQFSTSFMNLGLSILIKKQQKIAFWYSFLTPFHWLLWLTLALVYVGVSLLFFAFGRLSPAEWNNPFPCIDKPKELQNQFTINNAMWFTMGAMLQQGSEIAPIGLSTRVLASSWYFFCLIMVNTYLANLAACLVTETPLKLINGIEDLYDQENIKFGAKINGSTFRYFESSSNSKHRKLFDTMNEEEWKKKYIPNTNEEGIELVKRNDTNYAFFMESSSIDYIIQRDCDLEKAGDLIDHKSYAIAYAKDFKAHHEISKTISLLEERSILNDLRKKWWDSKGAVCGVADPNIPESLVGGQMVGVFIVLGCGIIVACLLTAYELHQSIKSIAKTDQHSFMKIAAMEMKNMTQSKPIKPVLAKQRSTETCLTDNFSCNLTMTTQA